MKEYTSYKTPSKQLGHSIKKSVLCIPDKPSNMEAYYQDESARNTKAHQALSAPPANVYNSSVDALTYQTKSVLKNSQGKSYNDFYPRDEEHALISNYSNRLYVNRRGRYSSELNLPSDTTRQKELIAKLEVKNREIMREIILLRKQQEEEDEALRSDGKPTLLHELRALRMRKADLEHHLSGLQESRRDLVLQLEVLMRMLKDHSPLSSPNSSPLYPLSTSPIPLYPLSSMSAPTTPGSGFPYADPLYGLGGDVRLAFGQAISSRSLQNDLLVAADSVTNAMSSLVHELNFGVETDINSVYGNETWSPAVNGIDYQIGYPNSYLLDSTEVYEDEIVLPVNGTYTHIDGIEWEDDTTRWVNR